MTDTRTFLLFLLGVFLPFAQSACAESESWNGRIVSVIESPVFSKVELSRLEKSLGVSVGRPLDLKRLDDGLRELFQNGKVQTLFVEAIAAGDSVRLVVRGARARRLRKLTFRNLDPDILNEVRRRTGLEEGQLMDVRSFNGVRDRLKAAYEARGYYYSNVQIVINDVEDSTEADVEISVQPNAPTRVTKVTVAGGTKEENAKMLEQILLQRGDRFDKELLDRSVEAVNRYLKNNQYPTSKVEEASLNFSDDTLEVEIDVSVKMGSRFQYQFLDNTVFSDADLRDVLTEEMLTQADATTKIIDSVETKYHAVGFHFARVRAKNLEPVKDQATIVQLVIDEGPRVIVDELTVSGEEALGEGEIVKIFFESAPGVLNRHVYWEIGIKEATSVTQQKLRAMGFLSARLNDPKTIFSDDKKGVHLFLDVDLGPRTIIEKIEYGGISDLKPDDLKAIIDFKEGQPLDKEKVFKARKMVLEKLSDDGFNDVKYLEDDEGSLELSRDQKRVTVKFHVVEGRKYHVGVVHLEGNLRTKSEVIYREMKLKSGDVFSPRKMRSSEEGIGTIGLFGRVEITATTDANQPDVKNLNILVKETRPGVGEVGLGSRYEDPRLRVRGFVGFAYRNLNGLNQTASARTEVALPFSRGSFIPFVEYSATLGYRVPNIWGLPVTYGATAGLERFEVNPRPSTILGRARIDNRLERKVFPWFTAIYRLHHFERTITEAQPLNPDLSLPDPSVPRKETNRASIGSMGPGVILDFRNDTFNPTKGTYHTLDVELAHPYLLSEADIAFVMAIARNSIYVPMPSPLGLSLFIGAGYAHSFFGGKPLPEPRLVNELSLGGQGSIRGFSPRSITSDPLTVTQNMAYYNARAELKIDLFSGLGFAVFFDTGQIFPNFGSLARADGVGVGFRYKTPVGPVVIDFAQGLGPKTQSNENVKFYFTVGSI